MMEVGPWRFDEDGELWETEGGWEEYANIVYGGFGLVCQPFPLNGS
jgi:hypothetical protein